MSILNSFLLIGVCLVAGVLLRRVKAFPSSTPQTLNAFVIYLAFPALVLVQVPALIERTQIDASLLIPISMAWLQFGLVAAAVVAVGRWRGWSRATIGALVLTGGLGNTSFVGFPVVEAFYGQEGLQKAIIVDQLGSFLVVSILGIIVASYFSGAKVRVDVITKRVLLFPPFIAIVLAALLHFIAPAAIRATAPILERIGGTLVPLALVSVGFQLRPHPELLKRRGGELGFGLALKLVLIPTLLSLLYIAALGSRDLGTKVAIIEAAMAPMITGAIVAGEYELDSEIASLMVGIGIPLSLLTIFGWHAFLSTL